MKIKNIISLLIIGLVIFSCKKDDDTVDFDAAAQAIEDDNKLIEYLQSHYLNEEDGGIWTITNGETPLMGQVSYEDVVKDEIEYKLYYLTQQEGESISPTKVDSVLSKYTGMLLDSTVFDTSSSSLIWFSLTDVIAGWSYGFPNFKGGTKIVNSDESFNYENYGKGILFIPSGLAYGNLNQQSISANSPLIFHIELHDVNYSDHDNDGILSKDEDTNGDGDFTNDDTDGDGIPNYLDSDN
ncbi:FKBP-type peptidyl-prolyl cis-trans isomerase [Lutibacter flavus]|uniref:Peptidyl-prolyl cis-trans isomerase n=1 Tax=Lutibacter flavus TaxID=691689 RepID=A0A238VNY1_9FLAO|nr:FKBP-type peptidyl-prolyl cis-trans isomerase [Lutibacter flavus]SNR35928.1 FKBP-type peptidyl-prolyl cis-trans isomerase [Lutibacter flavus]